MPFLDILVHRTLTGPKYSIYRKPTHVPSYLHFYSQHPPSQKRGIIKGLYLRAFRLSSPEFLDLELQTLETTFINLGYPQFFIRSVRSEARTKHLATAPPTSNTTPSDSRMKTVVFPYHPDLAMLNSTLKDTNIRFTFTSRNTIGRTVVSKKSTDASDSPQQSGVYAIECEVPDCKLTY